VGRSKGKQRKLKNTLNNFISMPKRLQQPHIYRGLWKDPKDPESSRSEKYLEEVSVDMVVDE
jgi:hypothetical protein